MLRSIDIADLALIEELHLEFGPGLNVVTGETGAGKSLLQRALAAAVGHRVGSEVVREGRRAARVEALFDLADCADAQAELAALGIAVEESVRIRRVIPARGRAQVSIADGAASVSTLKRIGDVLVHLQGQHESLRLAQVETHLEMLDAVSGTTEEARLYRERFGSLSELIARMEAALRGEEERERRLEMLRFDLRELDEAQIESAEEMDQLEAERGRLRNVGRLHEASGDALRRLHGEDGAALAAVEEVARRLADLQDVDPSLGPVVDALEEAAPPLAEAVRELQSYTQALDADPSRLEQVEERLALLARLLRKHRVESLAELLEKRDALGRDVERADRDVADPSALQAELEESASAVWADARRLSAKRRKGARRLGKAMAEELGNLGMPDAAFHVEFDPVPAGPAVGPGAVLTRGEEAVGSEGLERAEFYLEANPGEGARPLVRVASGGELSRIMLALRHVTGGEGVATLVFDEVDAGIGGAAAETVGRRLATLATRHQVVCITHLAQIAAYADRHYAVVKRRRGGRTRSHVSRLEGDDRVEELARMMAGASPGDAGRDHAAEMLRRAKAPAAPRARRARAKAAGK